MAIVRTFRYAVGLISKPTTWLANEVTQKFTQTVALVADLVFEASSLAAKAHLLARQESPPDALGPASRERQIERAPAETDPQHRARLLAAWDIWNEAGTPSWASNELKPIGVGPANVLVFYEPQADWDVDENAGNWSRFVIVLKKTAVWGAPGAEWGEWTWGQQLPWTEKKWGSWTWNGDEATGKTTWGSSASAAEVAAIRRSLRKRKAGHEVGVYLVLDFGEHQVWGAKTWGAPGGTWGSKSAHWLLGQFWGDKYVFTLWGDVHPTIPGQLAVWGGNI